MARSLLASASMRHRFIMWKRHAYGKWEVATSTLTRGFGTENTPFMNRKWISKRFFHVVFHDITT
jgi:hypothetical protein